MRFSEYQQLDLPVFWHAVIPGRLHRDGSRYLPILDFELAHGIRLGVVDRHHRIDQQAVGCSGSAQLVFLLSAITVQTKPGKQALIPETSGLSTAPTIYGQITKLPIFERDQILGDTRIYTELHLDIGIGIVGVRTTLTAADMTKTLGAEVLEAGMWLEVMRSRIDILGFQRSDDDQKT